MYHKRKQQKDKALLRVLSTLRQLGGVKKGKLCQPSVTRTTRKTGEVTTDSANLENIKMAKSMGSTDIQKFVIKLEDSV